MFRIDLGIELSNHGNDERVFRAKQFTNFLNLTISSCRSLISGLPQISFRVGRFGVIYITLFIYICLLFDIEHKGKKS